MQTETIELPEYWAPALINGDYSGLDPDEAIQCENAEWRLRQGGPHRAPPNEIETTEHDEISHEQARCRCRGQSLGCNH